MEHTVKSLRKVILLEDSYFLQYMQLVWAYYQEFAPEEALELEVFQNFCQHLTLLEQTVAVSANSHSGHSIVAGNPPAEHQDKHTVVHLRVQLMNSFNAMVDMVETGELLHSETKDRCARKHFLTAIKDAYENIRNSPEATIQYGDCFKTCKLCEACALRDQCLRRKQE